MGNLILTNCFSHKVDLRDKLNQLWFNITNIDTFLSLRSPSPQQNEEGAKECEKWCLIFPVLFPTRTMTRKMVEMSLVVPRFIREQPGMINKILRLEQEGERLHSVFNSAENKLKNI
jgi:hypothetical protein